MKRTIIICLLSLCLFSLSAQNGVDRTANFPRQELLVTEIPSKDKLWIFIMAGQSNMAGRGIVEPMDTLPDKRILTINKANQWIYAKEPLHFYQSQLTGLDCGVSFARELLPHIPDDVSIALIPCAVGGTSIDKWLNDIPSNDVHLSSNLEQKINLAKQYGTIKGILWHQGESDATEEKIPLYKNSLKKMYKLIRKYAGDKKLPILTGKLGMYSDPVKYAPKWQQISNIIVEVVNADKHAYLIQTDDLTPNDDKIHFDASSQRKVGKRYAEKYLEINLKSKKKK